MRIIPWPETARSERPPHLSMPLRRREGPIGSYAGRGRYMPRDVSALSTQLCRAIGKTMHLQFAGIDLRHDDDDAWHCFEVNPSPAFTFFEQATGQPLTAALAQFLIDPLVTRAH